VNEKVNNNKKSKKYTHFFLFKFILFIFSLVILIVVLCLLINSLDGFFGLNEETFLGIILVSILVAVFVLLSIFEVLTVKEYRGYFIRKSYRIHQNELLRNCDLQKGQLQWHLDVLLKNHIIKKEKHGQYTIYFPITTSIESIENFKNLPTKSETTSKILELIQKNPGISSSEISKKINLARNTVKYHIDKLSEKNLILFKEKGRKIELYSKVEYFDNSVIKN